MHDGGPRRVVAGTRQDDLRASRGSRVAASSSISARTTLGDAYELLSMLDLGRRDRCGGPALPHAHRRADVRVESVELLCRSHSGRCRSARRRRSTASVVRHSGFVDPEQRYRQRYADLAVHPEVRAVFVARARMVTAIRRYLDARGYPRSRDAGAAAAVRRRAARPFTTYHHALDMPLYPAHRGRAVSQAADRRGARAGI